MQAETVCAKKTANKICVHYATGKQTRQEKEHRKKHRAYNIQKKRSSRLPFHAITLDVLPTKQHEHFLRSFNMTGTTGRSVCFVLRRHDSVLELAITPGRFALIHLQGCTGDLRKEWTGCKTVKQS